jgi:hypothetical protein
MPAAGLPADVTPAVLLAAAVPASLAAVPDTPDAEPAAEPESAPQEHASLNSDDTPEAKPPTKKKRLALKKKRAAALKKARARAAARRAAERRAAANPQAPFSQPWTGFTQSQP